MMFTLIEHITFACCITIGLIMLVYVACALTVKVLDRITVTYQCTKTVIEVLQWMHLKKNGLLKGNSTPINEIERIERKLFAIKQYHLAWDWHEPGIECKICRTLECSESGNCTDQCLVCAPKKERSVPDAKSEVSEQNPDET